MRRRNPGGGVRPALAAEYRRIAAMVGGADDGWHERFAARIDAGEPVEVHGYEVDMPGAGRVRVDPDGGIVRLDEARPQTAWRARMARS